MPGQTKQQFSIAVVGAGLAGASCAHVLSRAGHAVHLFDKSRGPGGRLATRRFAWTDRHGEARSTPLDHGAIGISAHSDAFQGFLREAIKAGWLAEWAPALARGSAALDHGGLLHLPVPDMPALCRQLLDGVTTHWSCTVDRLHLAPDGWQIVAGGESRGARIDALVLALPPAQAAPLLAPHRGDWAGEASAVAMEPCWTLMGVADAPQATEATEATAAQDWDIARPPTGMLACVLRSDSRPGRTRVPGEAHWVVHAHADWSQEHLEQPAAWVQDRMQTALAEWLGQPIAWQAATVHRWRYAMPPVAASTRPPTSWWDARLRLGVCGDFLGGSGAGAEGAWLSARSLTTALLHSPSIHHPSP